MDSLHEKLKEEVDVEKQSFERDDVNPYEIAVATAKYARQINDRARKYLGSDVDIYPRSLALKKFDDGQTKIVYGSEEPENDDDSETLTNPNE